MCSAYHTGVRGHAAVHACGRCDDDSVGGGGGGGVWARVLSSPPLPPGGRNTSRGRRIMSQFSFRGSPNLQVSASATVQPNEHPRGFVHLGRGVFFFVLIVWLFLRFFSPSLALGCGKSFEATRFIAVICRL